MADAEMQKAIDNAFAKGNPHYVIIPNDGAYIFDGKQTTKVPTPPNDPTPVPTVATPTFTPAAGTYTSAQSVTISTATSGAAIRYTTNGSTPTASSTLYSTPLTVAATTTIKAIALKSGMTDSAVAAATYNITITPPAGKVFNVVDYGSIYLALQAASVSGGTVIFPTNGQYSIDTGSPLSIAANVKIQGNGSTVKMTGLGFAAEVIGIKGNNGEIDKLIVDGNNLSKCGITIYDNVSNIKLTNSTVKNITQGGSYATDLVAGVLIKTGVVGVIIDSNNINNIRAKNAPAVSRGIMATSYNGTIAKNVTISNNTITDIYPKDDGDGIYFDFGTVLTNSIITGNTFERCAKRGIKISSPGVNIVNNHVINSFLGNNKSVATDSVPGIDMYAGISIYANDVTVDSNIIDGVGSFYGGIEVTADVTVERLKVTNNTITMGPNANLSGTNGMRVGDVSNFVFSGNKIVRASNGIWTWQGAVNGVINNNNISQVDYGIQFSTYVTGKPFSNVVASNNVIQAKITAIVNR